MLGFAREVTGDESIGWISGTATLYKPLDFLAVHDDGLTNRNIAYVLNMTPEWKPDWGGALQFYDRDDHIEEGYLPTFNALNLFRVPKRHSVSQVASFGGLRYSADGLSRLRDGWRDNSLATASSRKRDAGISCARELE